MKLIMKPVYCFMAVIAVTTLCFNGWSHVRGQDQDVAKNEESNGTLTVIQGDSDTEDRVFIGKTIRPIKASPRKRDYEVNSGRMVYFSDLQLNNPDTKIKKTIRMYLDAKTDAKKMEAKQEISTQLSNYFDADMKTREKEIVNIETRIKKLRAQLEKRRAAKDKIVDLQLNVLVNDADGLGFYSQPISTRRSSAGIRVSNPMKPLPRPLPSADSVPVRSKLDRDKR